MAADPEEERAAVRAADLAMAAALADKDTERFKALLTRDVVFLGAGVARGGDEVVAGWSVFFDPQGTATLDWAPHEVEVAAAGDLAYTIGEYVVTMRDAAGEPVNSSGKYLTVWGKAPESGWRVIVDGSLTARQPAFAGASLSRRDAVARSWPALAAPGAGASFAWLPTKTVTAASGDLALTVGDYTVRAPGDGGEAGTFTGVYFTVSKHGEEGWQTIAESVSPPRRADS